MGDALPRLVAEQYAKLLAYKDEYEVARLYSVPGFKEQLENTFEGDYSIKLHLAPPVLNGKSVDGRPKKRAFGQWILPLFNVLQRGRILRGTALDVFGYTHERRAERAWIKRYEQDIEIASTLLSLNNVELVRKLLVVPQQIRGFGVVKQQAMEQADAAHIGARGQLEAGAILQNQKAA